ncbi:hypothetical protein ABNF97_19975 [Plantactinospora sp. B6F1]|uniref:hypothetical protein n=1 Tax=Plantactinospora sp. B6F1 TaxID=3158971 RepID=UPI0010CFD9A7
MSDVLGGLSTGGSVAVPVGLIRSTGGGSTDLRVHARDRDGHRVGELRSLRRTDGGEAA